MNNITQPSIGIIIEVPFEGGYFRREALIDIATLDAMRNREQTLRDLVEPLILAAIGTIDANS